MIDDKKIVIRPSGVGMFFECSYRWYRDTYNPIRKVGVAAHFGTGIHKAAEVYYKESINSKKWASYTSDYEGLAIDTFREKLKEDEPSDFKEINQNEIENSIRYLSKEYVNNAKDLNKELLPEDVEKSYSVQVKSTSVKEVSGTLDIVGKNYIADIKTMGRLNSPSKYLIQQGIYAFLRQKAGENVEDLKIHRVITNPKKAYIDCVSIFDDSYININKVIQTSKVYLETIIKTCDEFEKTGNEVLFRGNPSSVLCTPKYCVYYEECKYRKLI